MAARPVVPAQGVSQPFVTAVEAIYAAAPDPSLWPMALQAMAECIGGVASNLFWQRDDGSFGLVGSTGLPPKSVEEYEQHWWRHDIRGIRAIERSYVAAGETTTDRDLVSEEELDTHPYFTEFLARYGLRWIAATGVSPDARIAVAISIHGAPTRGPFSDGELDALSRLGRHAENSLRLSTRLLDAELANVGLREALSRVGIGVFALDSIGRVMFSNPAGERLLGDGLSLAQERLRVAPAAARGDLEAAVAEALRGEAADLVVPPKPMLIERARAERPLTVYVLPIAGQRAGSQEFLTHTRAIVLAIDPGADGPPDPAVVRDLLGLTLGEARVASLVGSGLPPRAAAEKLGISEETARTALKRVFSKVGVARQSELTALLTKLVLRSP